MPLVAVVQLGMDYAPLRDHLAAGDFRKADDETRLLLIKLAGPDAVKRNWVYFTEVRVRVRVRCEVLAAMDGWRWVWIFMRCLWNGQSCQEYAQHAAVCHSNHKFNMSALCDVCV